MLQEEICTYEVCKLAKEKGFDWMPSMYFHSGVERDLREVGVNGANPNKIPHSPHISCPTQTQLQRWFREEKGLHISIPLHKGKYKYFWAIDSLNRKVKKEDIAYNLFDTYELALENALAYALKNLV